MGRGEGETAAIAVERPIAGVRARSRGLSLAPKTLYHVSPKRHRASIAASGLQPVDTSDGDNSKAAVYFFGSLKEAERLADTSSEIYAISASDISELQRVGDLGTPWWKSSAVVSPEKLRIAEGGESSGTSHTTAFDRHRFTQGDCWIFALALRESSPEMRLAKSELTDHAFCVTQRSGGDSETPQEELTSESLIFSEKTEAHLWDAVDVHGRERLDKFLLRGVVNRELWLCDNGVTHESRRERVREAAQRALTRLDSLAEDSAQAETEEILFQFSNESEDLHLWDCDLTDEEYLREWGPEEDYEGSWARARELVAARPVS